ncbi:MAG: DUF4349 domain-containing protein [Bacteroidota bacterium]
MNTIRLTLLVVLTIILFSCQTESGKSMPAEYTRSAEAPEYDVQYGNIDDESEMAIPQTSSPPPPPPAEENEEQQPSNQTGPKIIYTAEVRMKVDNLEKTLQSVSTSVQQAGGYISSRHLTNNSYEKEAVLEIRLPVDSFESKLGELSSLAEFIDYQNLDSRDVTAEWIDLESRLQTKRDVRDRYIEILRNRARKVEDILNAEDKIRVITEEIEAKEGRLRYLRDQVRMSTLTLRAYETQEYREAPDAYRKTFGQKIARSLGNGWDLIQNLLLGLISIWPLWLIVPILIWLWRRWRRS